MLNIAGGRLNIYTLHYQQQTESRWNSQATCAASRLNGGENICEWTLRCLLDIARINSHSTRLSSTCYFIYEWTMRYAFVFIVSFMNGHCGMRLYFIVLFINGHCGMHLSSSCYFIYEWTMRCLLDIVRINSHSTRLSSSCYL